jgi:SAM-dependent methyltransferase
VNDKDVLYDLGCGDGRIVITAVKERGCRGVGIDIDPQRIKESRDNAARAGVANRVNFHLLDLFEADISRATVVTLYLLSEVNLRLRPKLFRELKPGTRIVSHDFDMDKWIPDESAVVEINVSPQEDPYFLDEFFIDNTWNKHRIYSWVLPANVSGTWEWTVPLDSGTERFRLILEQSFQAVSGSAYHGAAPVPLVIKEGKILGGEFEFTLETRINGRKESLGFKADVRGDRMEGLVRIGGESGHKTKWRAKRAPLTKTSIDR